MTIKQMIYFLNALDTFSYWRGCLLELHSRHIREIRACRLSHPYKLKPMGARPFFIGIVEKTYYKGEPAVRIVEVFYTIYPDRVKVGETLLGVSFANCAASAFKA